MFNSLVRLFTIAAMLLFVFQYRYHILNTVLRLAPLRQFAVSTFMKIPTLRAMFMKQAFKY